MPGKHLAETGLINENVWAIYSVKLSGKDDSISAMEDRLLLKDSVLKDAWSKIRPNLASLDDKKATLAQKVGLVLAHPALGDVQIETGGVEKNLEKALELKAEGNTAFKVGEIKQG